MTPKIIRMNIEENGLFPNNDRLPLLIYKSVFMEGIPDLVETITADFSKNRWHGLWRNGIYPFHHYHSTAHEALGVFQGSAEVRFGGPGGPALTAEKGDVVLIPAGVSHCKLKSEAGFGVVGAYPEGQDWDMCYGKKGERPQVDGIIAAVAVPGTDPVYGEHGLLFENWQ